MARAQLHSSVRSTHGKLVLRPGQAQQRTRPLLRVPRFSFLLSTWTQVCQGQRSPTGEGRPVPLPAAPIVTVRDYQDFLPSLDFGEQTGNATVDHEACTYSSALSPHSSKGVRCWGVSGEHGQGFKGVASGFVLIACGETHRHRNDRHGVRRVLSSQVPRNRRAADRATWGAPGSAGRGRGCCGQEPFLWFPWEGAGKAG